MPKVYKIVKRVNGKLVSITASGKAKVQYKPGEWTYPPEWLKDKGYDLFAFSKLQYAIDFYQHHYYRYMYNLRNFQFWEAQSKVISLPTKRRLDLFSLNNGEINILAPKEWPKGTVCCPELKLLKQVKGGYLEDETVRN
jgi:hypothetical protein